MLEAVHRPMQPYLIMMPGCTIASPALGSRLIPLCAVSRQHPPSKRCNSHGWRLARKQRRTSRVRTSEFWWEEEEEYDALTDALRRKVLVLATPPPPPGTAQAEASPGDAEQLLNLRNFVQPAHFVGGFCGTGEHEFAGRLWCAAGRDGPPLFLKIRRRCVVTHALPC